MLTVMIHATVKQEMLDEFLDLLNLLVEKTNKIGCIGFSFNQNQQEPREFVLYEQWESQEAYDKHIAQLFEILGPARPGEPAPEKLLKMYEQVRPVIYNVIGQSSR